MSSDESPLTNSHPSEQRASGGIGFKNERIFQQTASNKASMKALGDRQTSKVEHEHEVRLEEQHRVPSKVKEGDEYNAEKALEQYLEHQVPLPPTSRLLSPTTATRLNEYHQSEEKKPHKEVQPLSEKSHLLSPTTASKQYTYHPPPPPESSARSTSPVRTAPVSDRLTALNTARKAAVYEKKSVETDPRENGWNGVISAKDAQSLTKSSNAEDKRRPPSPNPRYRDVKSKLLAPTSASKHGEWASPALSTPCKSAGPTASSPSPSSEKKTDSPLSRPRSSSRGPHRHVRSRLHNPTTASESSRYQSPAPSVRSSLTQGTSPGRRPAPTPSPSAVPKQSPPSVSRKTTSAQRSGQREKYSPVRDAADVGAMARGGRSSSAPPTRKKPVAADCVVSEQFSFESARGSAQDESEGGALFLDIKPLRDRELQSLREEVASLQLEMAQARDVIATQASKLSCCEKALRDSELAHSETVRILQTHYRLVADHIMKEPKS